MGQGPYVSKTVPGQARFGTVPACPELCSVRRHGLAHAPFLYALLGEKFEFYIRQIVFLGNHEGLIQHVRLRQVNFLGHILRMPEDELVRLYALYVPSHGRHRRGRQPTSIFKYMQQLLGEHHGQLSEKQIANLACHKGQWRALAVACAAADR
ncbi:hypothetical protein Bbelb_319800 [Branchiostoma belcheri]|nr:hypothetical protein Bbelb_319800 [Branchiostoma belcheri]